MAQHAQLRIDSGLRMLFRDAFSPWRGSTRGGRFSGVHWWPDLGVHRGTVRTCIVHLIRNSLDYASWKDRKRIATALRPIYTAVSADAAEAALQDFASGPWGQKHPTIVQSWRRA